MTGSDDGALRPPIIAFLLTCLREDEKAARDLAMATVLAGKAPDFYGCGGPAAMEYWQHFTPHRAMVDVDVKLRIIARHYDDGRCAGCNDFAGEFYPCDTLMLLTLPYADRPGYDKAWEAHGA